MYPYAKTLWKLILDTFKTDVVVVEKANGPKSRQNVPLSRQQTLKKLNYSKMKNDIFQMFYKNELSFILIW
jgi:hypothetical protein